MLAMEREMEQGGGYPTGFEQVYDHTYFTRLWFVRVTAVGIDYRCGNLRSKSRDSHAYHSLDRTKFELQCMPRDRPS